MQSLRPALRRSVPFLIAPLRVAPLLALAVALLGGCDGAPAPAPPAAKTGKGPAPSAKGSAAQIAEAEEVRQIYYQFVDAAGSVRFVPTLDAVPAEWRSRVGFVEMSSPPPMSPADAQRIRDSRTQHVALRTAAGSAADDAGPEARGSSGVTVLIYSADWCGYCRKAKAYMSEKGIAYEERNVDEPRWRDEMNAKAGPGGIPVFDVSGQILRGFSPERLDELVKAAS